MIVLGGGIRDDVEQGFDGLKLMCIILGSIKILKIFEVWHYDNVEQYHLTENHDSGLFPQYVNTFMKLKLSPTASQTLRKFDEFYQYSNGPVLLCSTALRGTGPGCVAPPSGLPYFAAQMEKTFKIFSNQKLNEHHDSKHKILP
uniref:Uncharacterized protein n=1 Tax=Romanomermis culicivorax TaxID=13658 RepID=A0A915IYK6_ROMCU